MAVRRDAGATPSTTPANAGRCSSSCMLGRLPDAASCTIIDWVVRMATQPQFELDQMVLAEHLAGSRPRSRQLLDAASFDADNCRRSCPTAAGGEAAVARRRRADEDVQARPARRHMPSPRPTRNSRRCSNTTKPMVQALVAARLGHKSTLEETRTERLLAISRVTDKLPVPLKYSGAHTHRFSGDWKINLQNLPRGGQLRTRCGRRRARSLVAVDASQIEARINATLVRAGQSGRAVPSKGEDVYCQFAEDIYGQPVDQERDTSRALRRQDRHPVAGLRLSLAGVPEHVPHAGRHRADRRRGARRSCYIYRRMFKQITRQLAARQRHGAAELVRDGGTRHVGTAGRSGTAEAHPARRQLPALPRPAHGMRRRQVGQWRSCAAPGRRRSTAPSWSRTSSRRWPSSTSWRWRCG